MNVSKALNFGEDLLQLDENSYKWGGGHFFHTYMSGQKT